MIDLCPQCSYPLKGLPADHNCPECGLAYDADSEVYKHVAPRRLIVGLCCFAICATGLLYMNFLGPMAVGAGGFTSAIRQLVFLVLAAMYALTSVLIYRIYKLGPLVAVLPGGLFLRLRLRRLRGEWLTWDKISLAVANRAVRGATLMIKDTRASLDLVEVFKTPEDAKRFVDQVNRRIAAIGNGRDR